MPPSDNGQNGHIENDNCVVSASNSDDENGKNGIYNPELGEFDQLTSTVYDLDSSPMDAHFSLAHNSVLGDSDDDTVVVLSSHAVNFSSAHDTGNAFPPNLTEVLAACGEQTIGELVDPTTTRPASRGPLKTRESRVGLDGSTG